MGHSGSPVSSLIITVQAVTYDSYHNKKIAKANMNGKREYKLSQRDKMMCQKQTPGSVDACFSSDIYHSTFHMHYISTLAVTFYILSTL